MKRAETDPAAWNLRIKSVAYWGHLPMSQIVEVTEVLDAADTYDCTLRTAEGQEKVVRVLLYHGRISA